MPRLIDVDAFLDDVTERYCKDCERRKGIKNGKKKFIYDIGDAPCRACEVDDMKYELERVPTVDAEPVVRCEDCQYRGSTAECLEHDADWFCADGKRREDGNSQQREALPKT